MFMATAITVVSKHTHLWSRLWFLMVTEHRERMRQPVNTHTCVDLYSCSQLPATEFNNQFGTYSANQSTRTSVFFSQVRDNSIYGNVKNTELLVLRQLN